MMSPLGDLGSLRGGIPGVRKPHPRIQYVALPGLDVVILALCRVTFARLGNSELCQLAEKEKTCQSNE